MVEIALLINIALSLYCIHIVGRKQKGRKWECYTDYVCGNLTLRVYPPEFEYQAIGEIPRDKLLDIGTLNLYRKWALIEK